jgi:signal transduction histidine kinase
MLRENAFDLVLLDILMPEMDGYEVLKQIKESPELCNIPVIMISAVNELDSVVRCIELGAEDYISKPFNPVLLKARVGASLQKKRAHDREMALYDQLDHNFKNLQELEKLREDLTHMIIHDLRTPLTSVISGMQTMEVVGALNEPQREIMNIALFGGDTLLGIINELLDVEKLESGSMPMDYAELSPGNLVELAVSQVTSLATDKKQTVRARIATDLPLFRGDAGKLCRTLVNLLGNAIKFTPEGGEITASASYGPGRSSLLFSVRDTGVGIPAEAFGRIFEKFGQVESRQLGTGLGLTFCKLAVNAHGGIIEVESEPGMGSTFSFTIPIPSMA